MPDAQPNTHRTIHGRKVGAVGLGCMSFGGFYGPTTEAESLDCMAAAIDAGIDHFDTAERYGAGRSEEVVGKFLAQSGAKVSLATKGGIYMKPERHFDNAAETLRTSLEGSLKRLGVDHVDLYYVHRREQARPIEEVAETMSRFIEEGKIGAYGLSEVAPATVRRAHAVHPVAAVQNEYSLWTRQPELGLLQTCAELGITFVAFSPLARGMFGVQTPDPATFGESDFRLKNPRFLPPNFAHNAARIDTFKAFCRDHGWSPAAAALAWTLHQGDHVLPIPGTRTAAHLREFAAAREIAFSDAELTEIARLLPVGFAYGDRYSEAQNVGIERYC